MTIGVAPSSPSLEEASEFDPTQLAIFAVPTLIDASPEPDKISHKTIAFFLLFLNQHYVL